MGNGSCGHLLDECYGHSYLHSVKDVGAWEMQRREENSTNPALPPVNIKST
ncbi:hypothetical protein I79_026045 [Cricetulus griseus]|uniref:Uncharacterized protein n=1 Tax=Cricetulus griseus TaxID=10029 RepID=G3IPW2_CRIGR|nr:hypothetical protein I79_026045 [Cricetulus griseus]